MTLHYVPRRVCCADCSGVYVEAMPWVAGKQRSTRAWMVTLAQWARILPGQEVARLFCCSCGVAWRTGS